MKIIDEQLISSGKDIYLAGGCFWGTEHYFKQIEGVVETSVGFANGHTASPTYKEVYTGTLGTGQRFTPKKRTVPVICFESEIDRLVYQLYGLTEDEIKIVEGCE